FRVNAENNRHPLREQPFLIDFTKANIETDLSRLYYKYLNERSVLQSNAGFQQVADRLMESKGAKKGMSLAHQVSEKIAKKFFIEVLGAREKDFLQRIIVDSTTVGDAAAREFLAQLNSNPTFNQLLGALIRQRLSPAVSTRVPEGPFKDIDVG